MSYHTGATFYPGGEDSYYMPEVVSPQPQRIAEAPVNMQENVAHMEQQASWRAPQHTPHPQQYDTGHGSWGPAPSIPYQSSNEYVHNNGNNSQHQQYQQSQYQPPPPPQLQPQAKPEQPNFSRFPQLHNRGSNVPPSDEEREASLEAARESVLCSNDFETQLTWAQDALTHVEIAMQNEANVSVIQGSRPRTPRVEHVLKVDALKVVGFLAEQHHPRAEFIKGTWLEFGKFGHRTDQVEAYNCYVRSSEKGYARAYYRIGMQFENSNQALKAIKYYQMGVEAGDAAACYRLGMMTLLGQNGQMQDVHRGLNLIQTAAHRADDNAPQGAYVLGMLQAGELSQVSIPEHILPRNILQAKSSIEKAAFLGFAKAQLRMGQAYELGDLGCHFEPLLSLHYNKLAALQGEADAQMAISKWLLCGQKGLFEKDEEMAFVYAQRAAVTGLATAQFAMGYFYEVGIYVPTDLRQAREWYQKAEEGGNTDARKRIEAVTRSKTISRKDHENIAISRIRQQHAAAERGPVMPMVPEISTIPALPEKPMSPTIDMPDPAKLSLSSTPAPQRPTSTAPYPVGNPQSGTPSPNVRPTSAFGINPRLQQQNQYPPGGAGRPDPHRFSSAPVTYPSVDMPLPNAGYQTEGRRPSVPPAGYPASYRPQGAPHGRPGTTSPYMGPQNPNHSRPSQPPQSHPHSRPSPTPAPQVSISPPVPTATPAPDIGFTAPPDPRPDRKEQRRPLPSQQRPQNAPQSQPQTQATGLSPHSSQHQSHLQQSSQRPAKQQQQISQQPPQQAQPRPQQQTQHQNYNNIQPAHIKPSKPANASPAPRPDHEKPQKVAAATAVTILPGKGPKTFDEMGVPQAKKESDCVVM